MRVSVLVIFTCAISMSWASTAGTEFQLLFLENTVERPADGPLEVHVSNTGFSSSVVTVSSPRTSCASQTLTVPANSAVKFDVCWWMRLIGEDYWPAYKTVLVSATSPVSVYAFNKELYSADGYFAIPTPELSTSYYVGAYDVANIATQFGISATQDETNVQVSLPTTSLPVQVNYKGAIYTNGDVFSVRLNQYETYLAQSRGDLTGARVISSKPIALVSGNIRNKANSGSRDHLAAMLMGTGDWGTSYAIAPVPRSENYGDMVRIVGRRANTQFRIVFSDGTSSTQNLANSGDFYEYMAQAPAVIRALDSNKPLEVFQMVRSQNGPLSTDYNDPVMFLLVSTGRWLNSYISPSMTSQVGNGNFYNRNYALIAIQNGRESGLRLDGGTINPSWSRVDGFAFAWVAVSGGSHRFTHVSNDRFGVMVYGASDRESYGFALGADLSNTGCQESLMTRGDGLDNDCDGSIEEESCNKVDDDGDGLIDEDCTKSSIEAFGNEYVIMFMENNVDDNPSAKSFLEIYFSAVDSTASVQYSLSNSIGGTSNGTIPANQLEIFTNLDTNLRHQGSGIDNKAITIFASGDIVVYGINKQTWSTDGFLAFPVDVVGNEYYTSHYFPGTDLNEFAVTPVTPGVQTTVTVTMPSTGSAQFGSVNIPAGNSYTFNLQYGQTAQIQGASNSDNLNGARIQSSLPVSAFSGNVRARVQPQQKNSRDHLVQQLAPVSTWGKEYITLPIPRGMDRGDIFTITASQPNTRVTINIKSTNGQNPAPVQMDLLFAGDNQNIDIGSNQYAHIQSNFPIQVFQFVKTSDSDQDNADPAMMLIPPVEQWSRNYQFATPRTGQEDPPNSGNFLPFNTYVMIAINTNNRNGLRLDGQTISPVWTTIDGTSFSAAVLQVPFGRHSLTHIDSGVYFQALMYGRADRESYALPLGMRLVSAVCTVTQQTEGDSIDNDCDGSVDEELCNGIDDDADGQIDEDCGAGLSSGNSFYLTYMENTVEYPRDFELELYVAVVGQNSAMVSVRAPMVTFPSYDMTNEVQPGDVQAYGLTWRMRNTGQGYSNNTVFVRAGSEVVVYAVNKELFSNDGFLVYPENSLGSDYYTCSWSPSTLKTEFAVVGTADNTLVTITLPPGRSNLAVEANGQIYTSGTFTITLNRFQVYQAQSDGDLTGTRVQSSIRTAVFSGNVRTLIELSGSRDHLVSQMIPIQSYGSEFYVVPFPQRTVGDVLKIVAAQAGTVVRVNGNNLGQINTAGGFVQYSLESTSRVVVTSTNPIMVMQFVKSQNGRDNPERADPAMFLVPSTSNFITTATFITPVYSGGSSPGTDYTNFMTVVIQNGQQGNVRLNGNPLTGVNWDNIGNSAYVTATFDVPSGRSHTLTTTSGASFYGRLYGRADRESYAFPVGFRF